MHSSTPERRVPRRAGSAKERSQHRPGHLDMYIWKVIDSIKLNNDTETIYIAQSMYTLRCTRTIKPASCAEVIANSLEPDNAGP